MISRSEVCARTDGLEMFKINRGGSLVNIYKVPCRKCGEIMEKKQYLSEKIYLCDYCKYTEKNLELKPAALKVDESSCKESSPIAKNVRLVDERSKKERAFDKAIENIKKQVTDFNQYRKAIELAERRLDSYGSVPEIMVAIELLRLGHKVIPQQKIKRYRVDFALPDLKMVIEVDGALFHRDPYKGDREAVIQLSLGFDWKIVHLPAELISKDIKKLKKIVIANTCNTREKL